jgi:hypothetical protein
MLLTIKKVVGNAKKQKSLLVLFVIQRFVTELPIQKIHLDAKSFRGGRSQIRATGCSTHQETASHRVCERNQSCDHTRAREQEIEIN